MMKRKRPTPSGPTLPVDPEVAFSKFNGLLAGISQFKGQTASSPEFQAWEADVKIALSKFYGADSEEYARFRGIWFTPGSYYPGQPNGELVQALERGLEQARLFLASRLEDWRSRRTKSEPHVRPTANLKDVFVVHGHDHGIKEAVARFLSRLGLNPVILHEQPDEGRTVIEKFEKYSDVSFAVAVFSGDDFGVAKREISGGKSIDQLVRSRARQNVVLEFGYFVGRLGRRNVVAIVEDGVETPSDYSGVLYIPFDGADGWQLRLVKELKAAGLDVDANAAF